MAGIERFEDIEAWKTARELVQQIYKITNQGMFVKDYGLRDQIRRAAVSIMANIAEGFDSGSDREFIKFLGYALRSTTTEVQSHLYVSFDQNYISKGEFDSLYRVTVKVKNLISRFVRYLKSPMSSVQSPTSDD
jgi:four helix bundle protein